MKKKKVAKKAATVARHENPSLIIQLGVVFIIVTAIFLFAYVMKNFS